MPTQDVLAIDAATNPNILRPKERASQKWRSRSVESQPEMDAQKMRPQNRGDSETEDREEEVAKAMVQVTPSV
jgi:hypothetical protein